MVSLLFVKVTSLGFFSEALSAKKKNLSFFFSFYTDVTIYEVNLLEVGDQ